MRNWVTALLKLGLVLGTIAVVGAGIYTAYRYAFPPVTQTAKINLPNLSLTQCGSPTGGFDPADLGYAAQLQQHQNELAQPASSDSHETTFSVAVGELPADVAGRLQTAGFIKDGDVFVTLLKCRHASEKIQAGDHTLRRNMTMDEIILALEKGVAPGVTVRITPGWRAEQVAQYLGTLPLTQFNKDDFLQLVKAGNYSYDFLADRPKGASGSVEGYLFPETYDVLPDITDDQLINRFLAEFAKQVAPDASQKAAAENLTLYQALTLASIIEREAVLPDEAPVIASVYLNRIKKKMLLNADPTVQYALGYQPETQQWWPVVPIDMYAKVDSPYNTYLYTGLPPGPICEPGLNSLLAVLQPASTDYLYFLAKGDGSHVFARTLEEQNANLAKYGYAPLPTPKPKK